MNITREEVLAEIRSRELVSVPFDSAPLTGGSMSTVVSILHNFLFDEGRLSGVIDPNPEQDELICDLVYAYCSTPDDLAPETIQPAAAMLKDWQPADPAGLHRDVLLGMYRRIACCILFHPHDLRGYLQAWHRWRGLWGKQRGAPHSPRKQRRQKTLFS